MAAALAALMQTPALRGLDPVELCHGREVTGKPTLHAEHEGIRYVFSSVGSRARFLSNRDRFAIQIGGACGNMGPLSGRGNLDRYVVFEGRIWVFASLGCRDAFLAAPKEFLDDPEPKPKVSPKEVAKAREMLDKAAVAHGGNALDAMKSLAWETTTFYKVEGVEKPYIIRHAFAPPSRFGRTDNWEGKAFGSYRDGARAWFFNETSTPMGSQESSFLARTIDHHPVVLLARRGERDIVAAPAPSVDGLLALVVHADGANSKLLLDPKENRVVGAEYRVRGGKYRVARVRYGDFRRVGGVLVPYRLEDLTNEKASVTYTGVFVDRASDAAFPR